MTAVLVIACIALTIALVCSLISRRRWKLEAESAKRSSDMYAQAVEISRQTADGYKEMVLDYMNDVDGGIAKTKEEIAQWKR